MGRPPRLTDEEVQTRLTGLSGWQLENGMLQKRYRFKTFMDGIAFVNRAAALAEEMYHHPDIYIGFGLVTISLTTHSVRGLTSLDFDQAARLDGLS